MATPLLRLQIDSLVRTSYIARARMADSVANEILGGGEFRKMKDAEGKRLFDFRLVELAEPHHPWAPDVYDATSAWLQFSPISSAPLGRGARTALG